MSRSNAALIASLTALFQGLEQDFAWEHAILSRWLIGTRSFWRLAGQGLAFDEMRRLVPRTGGNYELCLAPTTLADLLVLDGTFSGEEEDPAYWAARIAPGAVVVVAGIHPAAGASELWRRWCEAMPAPATFRVSAGRGLGLLLPVPEAAPRAVRELCLPDPATAALFEAAARAAQQTARAIRDAEAARALACRLRTSSERLEHERLEHERLIHLQLAHERARADALAQQMASLESTTTFRAMMVLRRIEARLPPRLRAMSWRALRLARTLGGRLITALRTRREVRRGPVADSLRDNASRIGVDLQEPDQRPPQTAVTEQAADATTAVSRPRTRSDTALGAKSLIRVALGYAVADANLPRLTRAVGRAHRALAAIGQRKVGCVLVADDGAPISLQGWLPADVVAMPRGGASGFLAAHARMMEVAFAQGADAYVLTETRARFGEGTLAAALCELPALGSPGLVFATYAGAEPWADPASPTFLVITRDAVAQLGPLDDRLDAPSGLIDLCMRAETLGIPVSRLEGHAISLDARGAEAFADRWPVRHSLDAAWVLAGKWSCASLTARLCSAYADRQTTPPPPVAPEYAGRDAMLIAWWERIASSGLCRSGAVSEPMVVREAVLPPPELDASIEVPFDAKPPISASQRMAAIVHLYYDDLGSTTLQTLQNIPAPCDLFITTDTEAKRNAIAALFDGWTAGDVNVCVLPNRGGNVGPMLEVLREIIDQYDILLHLHGKKSLHCDHGVPWRTNLYETLCGSRDIVASILAAFDTSPLLGIVFPQHWGPVRQAISWGFSFEDAQDLGMRIGIDLPLHRPLDFPTGFMFWARTAALAPLLKFDLRPADFVANSAGSTYAHAIERLLLLGCERSGHTWIKIARSGSADVLPPPLTVISQADLREQLDRVTYLLSDPALCQFGRNRSPWRFRPDDRESPRLTLIAGADWSRDRWASCEAAARAVVPELGFRVQIVPPTAGQTAVPSPIDVRARELFVATEEACAQIALQLVHLQHGFFGWSGWVLMLDQLSPDQLQSALQHSGFGRQDQELEVWHQARPARFEVSLNPSGL